MQTPLTPQGAVQSSVVTYRVPPSAPSRVAVAAPSLDPTDLAFAMAADPLLPRLRHLEAVAARSWPSETVTFDGSWAIRMAGHATKRQNSAVPLDPSDDADTARRIANVWATFARADRRPTFRITPLAHPRLDSMLDAQGWRAEGRTHVMVADLDETDAAPADRAPGAPRAPSAKAWVDALAGMGGVAADRAPGLLETVRRAARMVGPLPPCASGHEGPAGFHWHVEDEPVAALFAMRLGSDVGLMEVFTDPAHRGRGHARRLVTGALASARAKGAKRAWLQVEADNAPAIALYRDLGFETLYDYHYRLAPLD